MRLSSLTLMVSLIATAALAAEPYEGTWDTDLVQCLDSESQSRQVLMARDMGGYEESCKFTRVTKAGSRFTTPWPATSQTCPGRRP